VSTRRRRRSVPAPRSAGQLIEEPEQSLLDVVDGLLEKGVVVNGELILALADVDLVYMRLSALLCASDRVFPPEDLRDTRRTRVRSRRAPR
jgi:hypothetical protein